MGKDKPSKAVERIGKARVDGLARPSYKRLRTPSNIRTGERSLRREPSHLCFAQEFDWIILRALLCILRSLDYSSLKHTCYKFLRFDNTGRMN